MYESNSRISKQHPPYCPISASHSSLLTLSSMPEASQEQELATSDSLSIIHGSHSRKSYIDYLLKIIPHCNPPTPPSDHIKEEHQARMSNCNSDPSISMADCCAEDVLISIPMQKRASDGMP